MKFRRLHNVTAKKRDQRDYQNNDKNRLVKIKVKLEAKLEFGMYPQSMPTEWTHARALRPWQIECAPRFMTPRSQGFVGQSSPNLVHV